MKIRGSGDNNDITPIGIIKLFGGNTKKHSDIYEYLDIISNRFDFFDKSNYNIVLFC